MITVKEDTSVGSQKPIFIKPLTSPMPNARLARAQHLSCHASPSVLNLAVAVSHVPSAIYAFHSKMPRPLPQNRYRMLLLQALLKICLPLMENWMKLVGLMEGGQQHDSLR